MAIAALFTGAITARAIPRGSYTQPQQRHCIRHEGTQAEMLTFCGLPYGVSTFVTSESPVMKCFANVSPSQCHRMSEGHQRAMQLFIQRPGHFMDEFSREFEEEFMKLMKTRCISGPAGLIGILDSIRNHSPRAS